MKTRKKPICIRGGLALCQFQMRSTWEESFSLPFLSSFCYGNMGKSYYYYNTNAENIKQIRGEELMSSVNSSLYGEKQCAFQRKKCHIHFPPYFLSFSFFSPIDHLPSIFIFPSFYLHLYETKQRKINVQLCYRLASDFPWKINFHLTDFPPNQTLL